MDFDMLVDEVNMIGCVMKVSTSITQWVPWNNRSSCLARNRFASHVPAGCKTRCAKSWKSL